MGERLGRVEALIREGVTPIPPDVGVDMLMELLKRRLPTVAVVVTSRFGKVPTLGFEHEELPFLRFLERPRVHYPGVELVCDAELSSDTDPYLAEHALGGERLLPAVMGLEAMAQVAMALAQTTELPVFEHVEFRRPVVVPEDAALIVRLASLVRRSGEVEVVLRTETTGFAIDHFRASCRFPSPDHAAEAAGSRLGSDLGDESARLPLRPESDLYGGILFQRGRFRRLLAYRSLRATECLAEISPDGNEPWFGRFQPPDLVLGDPASRDAALHGIQACIPHARVLPTAVDRVTVCRIDPGAHHYLAARERLRDGDTFVYDLEVIGDAGRVLERWEGLRLKVLERLPKPPAWHPTLLGPYVERRLQELLPGAELSVLLARCESGGGEIDRRSDADEVLRRLTCEEDRFQRRPDGKVAAGGGRQVSVAHAGDLVMAVAGCSPIGCDLEPVVERPTETWRDLLGPERYRVAAMLEKAGADASTTRVWTAVECLKKAGALDDAPLVLGPTDGDGWRLLRSGRLTIGTFVTSLEGVGHRLALAVLAGEGP